MTTWSFQFFGSHARRSVTGACRGLLLAVIPFALISCSEPEPTISGSEPSLRRLTEEQYRNIICDLFGDHIVIAGRFDPILRQDGLIAIGAGNATISASSFDKYEKLARSIAEQVVNPSNRDLYFSCAPEQMDSPDEACAGAFLETVGTLLFRRPISDEELRDAVQLSSEASRQLQNFYDGIAFGLTSLLVNPNFLFVIDDIAPGTANDGQLQLSGYAKASRLSFFLWNTTPDAALLDAAGAGELDTRDGIRTQVDRMLASPKLRDGIAALFKDMLHLDDFEHLEKDNLIYPALDPEAIEDTRTQLILTIQHHLLDKDADYRSLFTTRETFINGALGRLYRTPVAEPSLWTPFELNEANGRTGIHSLAGFIALHSHPGRSSPTIRGMAVRELIMCQKVPDPPADIDFSLFNEPSAQKLPARERLAIHNSVASCAGCHRLTDDIGLSLENFDGAGQFRVTDGGATIDPSGNLDGVDFEDHTGLSTALSANPAVPACLVQTTLAYGLGRSLGPEERGWFDHLLNEFEQEEFRLKPLVRSIVTSDNFFVVKSPPSVPAEGTQVGSQESPDTRPDIRNES